MLGYERSFILVKRPNDIGFFSKRGHMAAKQENQTQAPTPEAVAEHLSSRIAAIIHQARANVVRSINTNLVLANWAIGRELVEAVQEGQERAAYGKKVLELLARHLTKAAGKGYSATNLRNFRRFYLAFQERRPQILQKLSAELALERGMEIQQNVSAESSGVDNSLASLAENIQPAGFSPNLSWSHYLLLARVDDPLERLFYEREADASRWGVELLERNISSHLFLRLLKSRDKQGMLDLARHGQKLVNPVDIIRDPYVLDFLDIPMAHQFHESDLEAAIISNLERFLLELGKGFAFVGRQYRVVTEFKSWYVDLVFFNYELKCFFIVDVKLGSLTHADVGQMDMYLRMFDDLKRGPDDNPTIGLILCAEKDNIVVQYSILNGNDYMFASQYRLHLPSEEEIRQKLTKEGKFNALHGTDKDN